MPLMSTLGGLRGSPTIPYTTLPTGLGFYTNLPSNYYVTDGQTLLIDTSDNIYVGTGSTQNVSKLSSYNGSSSWSKGNINFGIGRSGFNGLGTGDILGTNYTTPVGYTQSWVVNKISASTGAVSRSRFINVASTTCTSQASVTDGLGNIYIAGIHTVSGQNKIAIAKVEDGSTNFNLLTLRTLPYIAPSGSQITRVLDINVDISTGYVYLLIKDNIGNFVLLKLTPSSLSVVWAKSYGPAYAITSSAYGSIVSDGVNVYLCIGNAIYSYIYIIDMSTGAIVNQKSISADIRDMDIDSYGNIYLLSTFTNAYGYSSAKVTKFDSSLTVINTMDFRCTSSGSNSTLTPYVIKHYNDNIYLGLNSPILSVVKIPNTLEIIGGGIYTAGTYAVIQESGTTAVYSGSHSATTYISTTWTTVSGTIVFLGDTGSSDPAWTNTLL